MTDDSMTQATQVAEQGSEEHLARVARMFEDGSIFGRAEAYVNACLQGAEEGCSGDLVGIRDVYGFDD